MNRKSSGSQDFDNSLLSQKIVEADFLNAKIISSLKSVQTCKNGIKLNSENASFVSNRWLAICVSIVLLLSFETLYKFVKKSFFESSEECLWKIPGNVDNLFMNRFNCSICEDLRKIDKVNRITPDLFEQKYAYTSVPVVVEDAMVNWTTNIFNFQFLKNLYLNVSPSEEFENNCQFFPYKTEFKSLREVFEMSEERAAMKDNSNPWYVGWSNCNPVLANILRKHYTKPYFLPSNSESSRIDWIFMGVPGYGAHLHIDHVGNPSWQAQITGTKVWTIRAPPECYLQCHTLEITVKPGDMLVIDTDKWYHKTLIVGDEISITIGSEFD